jgi:hypothetical protein
MPTNIIRRVPVTLDPTEAAAVAYMLANFRNDATAHAMRTRSAAIAAGCRVAADEATRMIEIINRRLYQHEARP